MINIFYDLNYICLHEVHIEKLQEMSWCMFIYFFKVANMRSFIP